MRRCTTGSDRGQFMRRTRSWGCWAHCLPSSLVTHSCECVCVRACQCVRYWSMQTPTYTNRREVITYSSQRSDGVYRRICLFFIQVTTHSKKRRIVRSLQKRAMPQKSKTFPATQYIIFKILEIPKHKALQKNETAKEDHRTNPSQAPIRHVA